MNVKGLLRTCLYGVGLGMGIFLMVQYRYLFSYFKVMDWSSQTSWQNLILVIAILLIIVLMIVYGLIGLITTLTSGGTSKSKLYHGTASMILMFFFYLYFVTAIVLIAFAGNAIGDILRVIFCDAQFYLMIIGPVAFLIVRAFTKNGTPMVRGIVASCFSAYMIIITSVYYLKSFNEAWGYLAWVLMIIGGALYSVHEFIPDEQ